MPEPMSGCALFVGHLNHHGYGTLASTLAHRVAYELTAGPVPEGMQLDHLCRVRCCVNPAHLEVVTARENTRRGVGPGARNARKTHCAHGHPFNETNTRLTRYGRTCRRCENARKKARRQRRAAERKAPT